MARYNIVRRRHHPIRNILLVLLAIVLVYLGFAGVSLYGIYEDGQTAQAAYQQAEQSLSSGDVGSAVTSLRRIAQAAADVGDEADSWVWVVGEHIPWIGEDVTVGRGLAHVSDSLCNDALLPVVEQYEGITSGSGSVGGAVSAYSSASDAVSSCSQELAGLGTSHFSQLNDAKDKLSQVVSLAGTSMDSVSSILSSLGALGGSLSS